MKNIFPKKNRAGKNDLRDRIKYIREIYRDMFMCFRYVFILIYIVLPDW